MIDAPPSIMIIDDDVALRTAFARALERVGYVVVTAEGAPEIVDLVVLHQPAMILLDNHMPGATGVQLIKLIRQRWSRVQLPIVLISGSSIQGEISEAMNAGANDFRRKPVELPELIAVVEAALATPRTPEPVAHRSIT